MTIAPLLAVLIPVLIGMGGGKPISQDGYITLNDIIQNHRFHRSMDSETGTLTLRNAHMNIVLQEGSRKLLVNGMLIWLNAPAISDGKQYHLSQRDITHTLEPLIHGRSVLNRLAMPPALVMLDPGHGGKDGGASANGLIEKELTLALSAATATILRQNGIKVHMTREDDSELSLAQRTKAISTWGADLFVSIHFNYAENKAATGIETFVIASPGFPSTAGHTRLTIETTGNRHEDASMVLAAQVHSLLLGRTRAIDRGIKRARYSVLRDANCPAILVECGFLSSRAEAALLRKPAHIAKLAEALAGGIIRYMYMAGAAPKR